MVCMATADRLSDPRCRSNHRHREQFDVLHQYLRRIENEFGALGGGWENFSHKRGWTVPSAVLFWIALILATVAIGTYGAGLHLFTVCTG